MEGGVGGGRVPHVLVPKDTLRKDLTIPVTSERVFSALMLHCHKSFTDTLDTVNIACANEQRKGHFEKFEKGCTYG